MDAMSEHGITAQVLTGKAMGEFGSAVVQGAASSSSDMCAQCLLARNVSAPPFSVICDASAPEPQTGFCGTPDMHTENRVLGRGPSDPSKRARGGVTSDLLRMRNGAMAAIRRTCQALVLRRQSWPCVGRRCATQALCKKTMVRPKCHNGPPHFTTRLQR